MEVNMTREIEKEVKLRRDAKKLIIDAVRKEPALDRNVKAWLKTEKDNSKNLDRFNIEICRESAPSGLGVLEAV
jgi:hypothetical protein